MHPCLQSECHEGLRQWEAEESISRGAEVADLPFQEPTTLTLNLRTARAMQIAVPPTPLALATASSVLFAALHEAGIGTTRTSGDVRGESAGTGGAPEREVVTDRAPHGKPHRTKKILSDARRRGSNMAARGARAAGSDAGVYAHGRARGRAREPFQPGYSRRTQAMDQVATRSKYE